jgi:hypothetical protein
MQNILHFDKLDQNLLHFVLDLLHFDALDQKSLGSSPCFRLLKGKVPFSGDVNTRY